ncbi:hypothetical protein Tco_0467744 [Tanacetum coccineum]
MFEDFSSNEEPPKSDGVEAINLDSCVTPSTLLEHKLADLTPHTLPCLEDLQFSFVSMTSQLTSLYHQGMNEAGPEEGHFQQTALVVVGTRYELLVDQTSSLDIIKLVMNAYEADKHRLERLNKSTVPSFDNAVLLSVKGVEFDVHAFFFEKAWCVLFKNSVPLSVLAVKQELKPLEFQVGDRAMLKVSPWKGVVRFGKRRKLNPRYVGPFKALAKVGAIAYKLELPQELSRVHHTFHVSNLKKCYADEPLAIPLNGLHIDDNLYFIEEPIEIMDREVKRLKQSRILIFKV